MRAYVRARACARVDVCVCVCYNRKRFSWFSAARTNPTNNKCTLDLGSVIARKIKQHYPIIRVAKIRNKMVGGGGLGDDNTLCVWACPRRGYRLLRRYYVSALLIIIIYSRRRKSEKRKKENQRYIYIYSL